MSEVLGKKDEKEFFDDSHTKELGEAVGRHLDSSFVEEFEGEDNSK